MTMTHPDTPQQAPAIENCPECDGDDITVDSSSSMQLSEIFCGDCGYKMQSKSCEEVMTDRWNKAARKAKKSRSNDER
jgi:Zn ribbon nucleic-acid-binding protein